MPLTTTCPACGAPVEFRAASSIFAVCAYCQSTLVRHDQALEDIGKMAALAEDRSPLQLGTEGVWQGVHFALIGRIQVRYRQGIWNEWHLLFDDQRTGWLSEAGGEYALTFLEQAQERLPEFASLRPGQRFMLHGRPWTVSNLEEATCIAGEGELPFRVGAGYPVPAVDLRNGANFATLDYSETPPLLFVGQSVELAGLHLAHLRDPAVAAPKAVAARVFRCPGCGGALSARHATILGVGCPACGTVVDSSDETVRILSRAQDLRDAPYTPRLPLGTQGTLDGVRWEVIGFLVRRTVSEGIADDWREYLLAEATPTQGRYAWLSEYRGHWTFGTAMTRPPAVSGAREDQDLRHEGVPFRHFATLNAEVVQVTGEFTWRVQRGESCRVTDYVAPPQLLSRESGAQEVTWTAARYVEIGEMRQAFATPTLPDPIGVHAAQPNPWTEAHRLSCRRFWQCLLFALLLQAFFHFGLGSQRVLQQDLTFTPPGENTLRSREFTLPDGSRKLTVRNQTSLDNDWLALELVLVNQTRAEAWPATREIAYYAGVDSDGSWSEGQREDEVVFHDLPPGTYYLTLDPEFSPEASRPVRSQLEISRGGTAWSNFWLLLAVLVAFPLFSRARQAAFETRRWLESDHPPADEPGDEED